MAEAVQGFLPWAVGLLASLFGAVQIAQGRKLGGVSEDHRELKGGVLAMLQSVDSRLERLEEKVDALR